MDGRVLIKDALDLHRVDVFAAADEHVLLAIDDVVEALAVHARHVAGMKPAVGINDRRSGLGLVVVARKHRRSAQTQLARFTWRHRAIVLIHHLRRHKRVRPANRARLGRRKLRPHAKHARPKLGHAEALLKRDVVDLPERLQHRHRQRRPARGHKAHAVKPGLRQLRRLQHHLVLRRHAEEHRDPLALNQAQHPLDIPAPHDHRAPAQQQQRHRVHQQSAGMKHRRVDDGYVVA